MTNAIRSLSSVLLSLAILLTGHGLQQTLLPLHAQALGWSSAEIGITGSAYFIGFIAGCLLLPRVIRRAGHIRTFAICAAVAITAILLLSQWQLLAIWVGGRAVTGASLAGLYIVLESWLNENSPNELRGSVLSFYGFLCIVSMSIGQLLVTPDAFVSGTVVAAIIFALAILPVAMTTSPEPQVPAAVKVDFRAAYRASQVGPVMVAISGIVMGLLWSNGAVFASAQTGDPAAGAIFIAWVLLGGVICQLPVGRLSDHIDRRWVMLGLCAIGCLSLIMGKLTGVSATALNAIGFVLGGTAMPMYSVAIAHANDNAEGKFLAITSTMLVANGLGSATGPLVFAGAGYASAGDSSSTDMFFVILAIAYGLGILWTGYRLAVHEANAEHFEPFQVLPKTTLSAMEMDPRGDEPEVNSRAGE